MERRLPALIECLLLFVGLPVLFGKGELPIPLVAALWVIALVTAIWLRKEAGPTVITFWRGPDPGLERRFLPLLLVRFGVTLLALVALMGAWHPGELFDLPGREPIDWAAFVVAYPFLSAYPQEIVCRAYFFRRYRVLFSGRWMVWASAAAFGAIHLAYRNAVAPPLAMLAGWFFASTYARTGSLRLVLLEHSLYGTAVFTVGLGPWFSRPG